MVPRRRLLLQRLVPHGVMFPWRLSLLHCLSPSRSHSFLLRRSRFKVGKREQKRDILQTCSVKRPKWTKGEHDGNEVEEEKREEASTPMEDEMKIEEVVHEFPGVLVVPSNQSTNLRPCSVKRLKWTNGKQEDANEVEEEKREEASTPMEDEMKLEEDLNELPGIPVAPYQSSKPGIIFVFEQASLTPAFVGKTCQVLNSDDHANFLRRKNLNPYDYRPDIIYLALLEIMDSILYKVGMVQAIYVQTEGRLLFEIDPRTRIPRLFGSFCAMMSELLQKYSIKAKNGGEKILKLVVNPVTMHLPVVSHKIGLSFSSQKVVNLMDYVGAINDDVNLVFVVGAMAHGKINCQYADDVISVCEFPLSAACCVRKICCAVEKKWELV